MILVENTWLIIMEGQRRSIHHRFRFRLMVPTWHTEWAWNELKRTLCILETRNLSLKTSMKTKFSPRSSWWTCATCTNWLARLRTVGWRCLCLCCDMLRLQKKKKEKEKRKGHRGNRTPVPRTRTRCDNHYTMQPIFLDGSDRKSL